MRDRAAQATTERMPDDELVRLRTENQALRSEHEILAAMVKRAAREITTPLGKDIMADLDAFMKTSVTRGRSA